MEKQLLQDEKTSRIELESQQQELDDLLTDAQKTSGFYVDKDDIKTSTYNVAGGLLTAKQLIDEAKGVSKTELPEEGTVDVDIGAIRQNILNNPNLAQKLDIGERLEVPAEGGEVPTGQLLPTDENEFPDFAFDENGNVVELDDETKTGDIMDETKEGDIMDEAGEFKDGAQYDEINPDLDDEVDALDETEEGIGDLVEEETGGEGFGEGIEMTEMGAETALEGGEAPIGAFLQEEAVETAVEGGAEIAGETAGTAAATTAAGYIAGGLIAGGMEAGTAAALVGGSAAVLAATGPLLIMGAAGYMIYKTIDGYVKQENEKAVISHQHGLREAIRDAKYDSPQDRIKDWDDYFNPEKNPNAQIFIEDKNTFPPGGTFYQMKTLYPTLKKYTDGMNAMIDRMNFKSNLYMKYVGHGFYKYDKNGKLKFLNDPDGYDRGEAQHGVYKKMPHMSVGALLTSKGSSIQERMSNWQKQNLNSHGDIENGHVSNIIMADPYMESHFQQQAEQDPNYRDSVNEAYITYKIKQNQGMEMVPDYGDVKSPGEFEEVSSYWKQYYILNEKKFQKQDTKMVMESMKQYKQRKGKPTYVYHQPEMTPQQRYRWDRGFEQHMGGLIVTDKKTGRRITRSFDPTTYNKARIRRRKRHVKKKHIHGRDFRPVPSPDDDPCNYPSRGRRLGDDACKRVPKDGTDNKHEHNTSKPATVIQPHGNSNDYSYQETKEWALQKEPVSFDPNLASSYLGLAELAYDMPSIYPNFEAVPETYGLQNYNVREFLGRQENQTPMGFGFSYNSFGLKLYDEAEQRIVFAIEGTDSPSITTEPKKFISDLIVDLDAGLVSLDNLRVHRGMLQMAYDLFTESRDFIKQYVQPDRGTTIIFSAHSLGAGVSQILAYLLSKEFPAEAFRIYTFGSPRCMDAASAEIFSNKIRHHYRVSLEYDVITYLPPKLEGDKTGYTHAGMNIQYTHTGKMYEVLGRDEQLIFRTTIGASIAVLLMMVFLGNITHTLDIVGLGASYTPEGSTIIAYLKDTFRSYSTLPATLRRNAYVLFENLENLITNQQLAPNSLLNTIFSQREGIMRRFINSYSLSELEFRHISTEMMLTNASEQQFLERIAQYNIPTQQARSYYHTMQATAINMYQHFNPANPVSQRIYNTIFPTANSFIFYLQTLAVGKGSYNLAKLMEQTVSKPLDSHGRSQYRKALQGSLNFYHHTGHSVTNEQNLTDPYDHMFSGNEAYESLHTNCKLPEGHGRKLSDLHCKLPTRVKKDIYHSKNNYYLPSYHKGQVYMNPIPERYILGFYFYDEAEFNDRHDLLGFALF